MEFAGGVRALDDISLGAAEGQFVVIVGPSGSGKSTLLRLIAGLEQPTSGSILFDGRAVNRLPPRRRDVAMAFQTPALYPHLTVRENLAFPLRLRKVAAAMIATRVQAVAEHLAIESLLDRPPHAALWRRAAADRAGTGAGPRCGLQFVRRTACET